MVFSLLLIGGCGVLYPPGYHVLKWKSSYADTYQKGDTLVMPVWFYSCYEKVYWQFIDLSISEDSLFQFFAVSIDSIPFVKIPDTLRLIHLPVDQFESKQWHDDSLLYDFIMFIRIDVDDLKRQFEIALKPRLCGRIDC